MKIEDLQTLVEKLSSFNSREWDFIVRNVFYNKYSKYEYICPESYETALLLKDIINTCSSLFNQYIDGTDVSLIYLKTKLQSFERRC